MSQPSSTAQPTVVLVRTFGGAKYVSEPEATVEEVTDFFPDDRVGNAALNQMVFKEGPPVPDNANPVKDDMRRLRDTIAATVKAFPTLKGRCDVDAMIKKMDAFGISSRDTLDAVLNDAAMVPELSKHLVPSCPPAFVSLLKASIEAEEDEDEDDEGENGDEGEAGDAGMREEDQAAPTPSMIARFLYALRGHILEFMVPPDHMPWFKRHWIESRQDDPATLKEEFMFLAELELLFGSLLFGAIMGAFYGAIDEATVTSFKNFELFSFGFWTCTLGAMAVILAVMQVAISYLTIFIFIPVNANNFYAFVKTQSVEYWLNLGTTLIVISFYSLVTFIALSTCNIIGSSWLALFVTFGMAFVVVFPIFIVLSTDCLNLALWSGAYGPKQIVPDTVSIGGSKKLCDDVLCRRALANIKKYGKPIPADVLYGEPEDETAGEDKGAAKKKGGIGKRALRKKLVNHTHHAARIGMF